MLEIIVLHLGKIEGGNLGHLKKKIPDDTRKTAMLTPELYRCSAMSELLFGDSTTGPAHA